MDLRSQSLRAALISCLVLSGSAPVHAAGMEPFLGSVDFVAFNFAPRNWATCDGQILPIAQYTALFSLLGTTYGGNGQSTFALPDLRGRVPMHAGQGPGLTPKVLGQSSGSETHTLLVSELPAHNHTATTSVDLSGLKVRANSGQATSSAPAGTVLGNTGRNNTYTGDAPDVDLAAGTVGGTAAATTTVGNTGNGQPISLLQPYLVLNCIIALEGIFPSRP